MAACIHCGRQFDPPGPRYIAVVCSDRCWVGFIKAKERSNEHEKRTRARFREGKRWLEKEGILGILEGLKGQQRTRAVLVAYSEAIQRVEQR